ncbi:MAG: hypothetical protein JW809_19175 [Pirellulales bacterium]|nr:hypothetical protein [Pirellulales bacterium]
MAARHAAKRWITLVGVLLVLLAMLGHAPAARAQWRSVGESGGSPLDAAGDLSAARGPAPAESVVPGQADAQRLDEAFTTTLPRGHGQIWREYDLSEYTLRVTATARPEQAVIDWILRETGYEAWHGEPLAILSASPRRLYVYHTPEMQAVVAGIVDRFVASQARSRAFSVRAVSVNHPNWRVKAQGLLKPVTAQTPGTRAWVLQKEDAAVLLAELRRRGDYREHGSPHLLVNNGQTSVVSTTQPKTYVRDVLRQGDAFPGYQQETARIDEGFAFEFCPLLTLDQRTIDATVKCTVCQVEKMVPVIVDVPTAQAPKQKARLEVPQIAQFQFHERFRWPVDQVLLVSLGMVATPGGSGGTTLAGIPIPLGDSPARGDLLVFIESKGSLGDAPNTAQQPPPAIDRNGRY